MMSELAYAICRVCINQLLLAGTLFTTAGADLDYVPVSFCHRHFSRRKLPIPRHIRTATLRKRKAWKRCKQD